MFNPTTRDHPSFIQRFALSCILVLWSCSQAPVVPDNSRRADPVASALSDFEVVPFAGSGLAYRAKLQNGLRLVVVPDKSSPTFAYQTWFDVGSRNEKSGYTGLAHLFEHMMFKRTKNMPEGEFDRLLERAGAEGENAFTSYDYTAYVQELPSSQLDLIVRLESDRMSNLIIDDAALKTETEVVQNERKLRNENNADGILWQTLFELAFETHPYHWPVIGYEDDLNRVTSSVAMDFYRTHYSPNRAVVIVIGDVDPNTTLELVKKHYGSIEPAPILPETIPMEPAQQNVRRKVLKTSTPVEKLVMGYRIPGLLDESTPVLQVLQSLLTEGMGARLKRALVDTGIASSVRCGNYENKDPSLFIFQVNLQSGKKARAAESIILAELEKLMRTPVSAKELERALNISEFSFLEALTNATGKATFIGHYEIVGGDFRKGFQLYERLKKLTAADLQQIVVRFFNPATRTVVVGVPQ